MQAPILGADSQAMEAWIQNFVALLESAAPGEGKEGGGLSLKLLLVLWQCTVNTELR